MASPIILNRGFLETDSDRLESMAPDAIIERFSAGILRLKLEKLFNQQEIADPIAKIVPKWEEEQPFRGIGLLQQFTTSDPEQVDTSHTARGIILAYKYAKENNLFADRVILEPIVKEIKETVEKCPDSFEKRDLLKHLEVLPNSKFVAMP